MKKIKFLLAFSILATNIAVAGENDWVCSCDGGSGWLYGHKEPITRYFGSVTAAGIFEMNHSGHENLDCHVNGENPND